VRDRHPFTRADLEELDQRFLAHASAVVALQEVHAGNRSSAVIGYRHDMDADHSLATGVLMAEWEAERGYRSTYFVLHTSPYWNTYEFRDCLERIAVFGHEIGIHTDALAEALLTGGDPDSILMEAIEELRGYGFPVRGVAGHGNPLCNRARAEGEIMFTNDEQFVECARPKLGPPSRTVTRGTNSLRLRPRPLADFGLEYEALILGDPRPFRFSDSAGQWLKPGFDETALKFSAERERQLHMLIHPDWWANAFERVAV
jgi:hypothetical protein